jgi:hypothetical protein
MTLDEFSATLLGDTPPPSFSAALLALWHDAKGDWEAAHRTAQDDESREAACRIVQALLG